MKIHFGYNTIKSSGLGAGGEFPTHSFHNNVEIQRCSVVEEQTAILVIPVPPQTADLWLHKGWNSDVPCGIATGGTGNSVGIGLGDCKGW